MWSIWVIQQGDEGDLGTLARTRSATSRQRGSFSQAGWVWVRERVGGGASKEGSAHLFSFDAAQQPIDDPHRGRCGRRARLWCGRCRHT